MVKVEVIEDFTLERFNELKNIQRKGKDIKGSLFKGDEFDCSKELADYLLGNNKLNKAFIKIIEVIPEKKKEEPIEIKEEPKKTKKSKK